MGYECPMLSSYGSIGAGSYGASWLLVLVLLIFAVGLTIWVMKSMGEKHGKHTRR